LPWRNCKWVVAASNAGLLRRHNLCVPKTLSALMG
jgi:hypothetical protein